MTDLPTSSEADTAPVDAAPAAPAPADTLKALGDDAKFMSDWSGENGRAAQVAAVARKSELTRAAYGGAEDPAPALPDAVQDGIEAPDNLSQAAAAAMVPGGSPDDYSFTWANAATTELETLQEQTTLAKQAAFDIGANPEYARGTIRELENMIARSDGTPQTVETLQSALTKQFGSNADTTLEAAKASLAKMPEDARNWAIEAAEKLDASGFAWFVGRLASVHRATAPRPPRD